MQQANSVPLRLFRMIMRWAHSYKDMPFTLSQGKVKATCPHHHATHTVIHHPLRGATSIMQLARAEFRANKHTYNEQLRQDAINRAMVALQYLKMHMQPLLDHWRHMRAAHLDRDGVLYGVGQVVQHVQHNYKGVVYGIGGAGCARDKDEDDYGRMLYHLRLGCNLPATG